MSDRLASRLAVLTSAAVHVLLLLAAARSESAPIREPHLDNWAARSVEVGTVPELARATPEPARATPEPARATPEPARATPEPHPTPHSEPTLPQPPVPAADASAPNPRRALPSGASNATPHPDPVATSPSEAARTTAPTVDDPPGTEQAGSLGAIGLPPGTRHLATAFARALPEAAHRDAAWSELPLGAVGTTLLRLRVSETGQLEAAELLPEQSVAPVVKRMIERAALLLKSGTFSLDPRQLRAGTEQLSLEVTVSERAGHPDEVAAPRHLMAQGFKAPTTERPGYARFTLNSGRHMEAVVRYAATE